MQRRNVFDVISEPIHILTDAAHIVSHSTWQNIANNLLLCLGDEETAIWEQASNLLPLIDPSFVLPALVRLVCSSDEKIQPAAAEAFVRVLKHHNQKPEVAFRLLDSLSNLSQGLADAETGAHTAEGSKLDCDRVLRLILEWFKTVQDWNILIGPLIDNMLAEPSNATIVWLLSHINAQLAEAADVVLHRVLLLMKGQKDMIDEAFFS
ncbi:ARM repeat superfamily protein, putative [Theobroma cacao]|uniref:ARM repeat superfamily protein, putative n=1 Tax=Theobroma cacao TaxID=3641 RepID=A0A061F471_THECC|nr:ARM repeat superfamily protein, putative [Theobroma cacao]